VLILTTNELNDLRIDPVKNNDDNEFLTEDRTEQLNPVKLLKATINTLSIHNNNLYLPRTTYSSYKVCLFFNPPINILTDSVKCVLRFQWTHPGLVVLLPWNCVRFDASQKFAPSVRAS